MYPNSSQAYDRAITVFSPDGRLFQVEYAREAVKRGTTAVGVTYDKGVLLGVDRNIVSDLIAPESIEKIFKIDEHMAVATSGLVADARRLVEDARIKCQRNRLVYKQPVTTRTLTRHVCDIKQAYTQYGGARPFGTALLIAGMNDEPHLFETDPSGAFTEYYAGAIGMGKKDVEKVFEENYEKDMNRDKALEMALTGLAKVSQSQLKKEDIDMVAIEKEAPYTKISEKELEEALENIADEISEEEKEEGKEE